MHSPSIFLVYSLHRFLLDTDILFDFLQAIIGDGRQCLTIIVEEGRSVVGWILGRDVTDRLLRLTLPKGRREGQTLANATIKRESVQNHPLDPLIVATQLRKIRVRNDHMYDDAKRSRELISDTAAQTLT